MGAGTRGPRKAAIGVRARRMGVAWSEGGAGVLVGRGRPAGMQ